MSRPALRVDAFLDLLRWYGGVQAVFGGDDRPDHWYLIALTAAIDGAYDERIWPRVIAIADAEFAGDWNHVLDADARASLTAEFDAINADEILCLAAELCDHLHKQPAASWPSVRAQARRLLLALPIILGIIRDALAANDEMPPNLDVD